MIKLLLIGIVFFSAFWVSLRTLDAQQAGSQKTDVEQVSVQQSPTISPSPSPAVLAAKFEPIVPVRLEIPKISVDAAVEHVGTDAKGRMDVPKNDMDVGWFSPGYKVGEKGNAVLAGHLDKVDGSPAIFWDLSKLQVGDKVYVSDTQGRKLEFIVVDTVIYPYNSVPLEQIFGQSGTSRLNLITCGGTFDRAARNYSHRTIVFTQLSS